MERCKKRPIFCVFESDEHKDLYWAIPMGNWDHRSEEAKNRISRYINQDEENIQLCFYHKGNTDVTSIFFISDVIPITDKYIERAYIGKYTGKPYEIKNNQLLSALSQKLNRILAWENANPNCFRQHITDIKQYLIDELEIQAKGIVENK